MNTQFNEDSFVVTYKSIGSSVQYSLIIIKKYPFMFIIIIHDKYNLLRTTSESLFMIFV